MNAGLHRLRDLDDIPTGGLVQGDSSNGLGAVVAYYTPQMFGARGTGTINDVVAINRAIAAAELAGVPVFFPCGIYAIGSHIVLKTGVRLMADGALIRLFNGHSWSNLGAMLYGHDVSDVVVNGFTFDGQGEWSSTPFANPYAAGNSVGFSNNHAGVILDGASNVKITECEFLGLGHAVYAQDSTRVVVRSCDFQDLGQSAVTFRACTECAVADCDVVGILGNLTGAGDTAVASSCFADAFYVQSCQGVQIGPGNRVADVYRIGVVVEGDGINLNKRVFITGNTFTNIHSARGTEYNSAIWVESNTCDLGCVIRSNHIDNSGVLDQGKGVGVHAHGVTCADNDVIGWADTGIAGTEAVIRNNVVMRNGKGIEIAYQVAGKTTEIESNTVRENASAGIRIEESHGSVLISGNTITDNGTAGAGGSDTKCGVCINRFYNDQRVRIWGNKFHTSAGSTSTVGQLYGIVGIAGGDYNWSVDGFNNNEFYFSNVIMIAAYPANMQAVPSCFAYDNTAGGVYPYDLANGHGNLCSKIPVYDNVNCLAKVVGFGSAPPVGGTYMDGDVWMNYAPVAGGPADWVWTGGAWHTRSTIGA